MIMLMIVELWVFNTLLKIKRIYLMNKFYWLIKIKYDNFI